MPDCPAVKRDTVGRHGPYRLEEMREEDLSRILEIERGSFPDPWSRDSFLHEIRDNPFSENYVLRQGAPLGRIGAYASVWFLEGEVHINNIAVDPLLRRKGLGRRLMRAVLREGVRRGCGSAILQVRSGNEAALMLYRSMGFAPVGRRRHYYARSGEDAVVMSCTLKPAAPERGRGSVGEIPGSG
jgi:ribosomal-protein-alanine N-acetyltransferase